MPLKIGKLSDGADPNDWSTLDELDIIEPDPLFEPFAEVVPTLGGGDHGRGFPLAIWQWKGLGNVSRKLLRTYCTGQSARVYISTPTNEDDSSGDPVYSNFLCTMHWPAGQEEKDVRHTLDLDIRFTHLESVV